MSPYGFPWWTADGIRVCNLSHKQVTSRLVSDGDGGAIVSWVDLRNYPDTDIYAQRVDIDGNLLWNSAGVAICTTSDRDGSARIASDGNGGAVIAWTRPQSTSSHYTICARSVDRNGIAHWSAAGVTLTPSVWVIFSMNIIPDEAGGAIVTWKDSRSGWIPQILNYDVFAQRVGSNGLVLWPLDGVPVCDIHGNQNDPRLIPDGEGGAFVTWVDERDVQDGIYAQRIERNSMWGWPSPYISAVYDVPGDQGGSVNLAWDASRLDPWPHLLISHYSLWRAISLPEASLLIESGARLLTSATELDPEKPGTAIRMERLSGRTFYWELVDTQDAQHYETYATIMATLFDSTATCDDYHYFQVAAHSSDPVMCWTSPPDSGYSVDNLAPCPPAALTGEQRIVPAGLELTWNPNTEDDLDGYAIYRGPDEHFTPEPGNLLATSCDTLYFDGEWRWDSGYCYKVAAVDVHGNESECAQFCSDEVTGGEVPETPLANYLAQNFPNPFNPATRIAFGLEKPGRVSLRIYDAVGRLIRVLVDEHREAGRYEEIWDGTHSSGRSAASGIYFYRLNAGSFTATRKMILLK
jgi:hypothetical protein